MSIAAAAGVSSLLPCQGAFAAEPSATTAPVETSLGKVRGKRQGGISSFKGIPFGADTGAHRFQLSRAATAWAGVRDCFAFGAQAPQLLDPSMVPHPNLATPAGRAVAAALKGNALADATAPQSEDCLFLNIYTPDASPRRKRPVMVWLHGGGYTVGSGGLGAYDGSALAQRGDVVVVTVNHRLSALGYLYLGAFHDDFADSGNAGQLDIVLALQWVRDNIGQFGGDPGNVTIFGESGGGYKVSMLLASPPAKGLFHKAIIESGPGLRMVARADAIEVAERTLTALGIAPAAVHDLQTADARAIMRAMESVKLDAHRQGMGPVVDGRALPRHPFDPTAPEISRDIPLIIGTNKDEALLNFTYRPDFGHMSEDEARKLFEVRLGARSAEVFEMYRAAAPDDAPLYRYVAMATDAGPWIHSIELAERKAAQTRAPVYMYRFDWVSPVAGGVFRSPHSYEVAMVFDNTDLPGPRDLLGAGPDTRKMAATMSQAWANFAHTGNPSQAGLMWPPYETSARRTMIFDRPSRVVADPDSKKREFWARAV
jgi:para-nitrobenzyl esterase